MVLRVKLLGAAVALGLVASVASLTQAPPVVATATVAASSTTTSSSTAPTGVALAAKVTVKKYKNCKALNKKYKHGVGKKNAKDKVRGKTKPVKNFKKHNALYKKNKHLDRDKDGIACEKR